MRLKQINIAGFKSFVDSTKISFEQKMTAIVGPNGCGKSNIIDAVRWVLGERSAKNLRGDTMTDVIFNGASSRKPVGQGSVELIFDNTQERFKDTMAGRNQVSVRRVVNRDGATTYYLNNGKCRRKDITDIFLGTGLGPRSYAIIEQGTISRLVESKPQDLRVFIEEAAGISKYKERRRETETRIRHTRENLVRLADIRSELTLQVDKLHQQAEAAQRFKILKASERKYKAELAVFRWQLFTRKKEAISHSIEQSQLKIAQIVLSEKQNDINLFQIKQKTIVETESLTQLQQSKLELTEAIAKTEQNIKHAHQENIKLSNQFKSTAHQQINSLADSKQTLLDQEQVNHQLVNELPQLKQVEYDIASAQKKLLTTMDRQKDCQQRWDQCNNVQRDNEQQLSKVEIDIASQSAALDSNKFRTNEIKQSIIDNNQLFNVNDVSDIKKKFATENEALVSLNLQFNDIEYQINDVENSSKKKVKLVAQQEGVQQALQLNLSKLECSAAAQADWLINQTQWLKANNISFNGIYHQKITVDNKWQSAYEQVLSVCLQAQVVDVLPNHLSLSTALLVKNNKYNTDIKIKANTLAGKIQGNHAFTSSLNKVYLAENLMQAHQLLPSLSIEDSVICPDGTWLGHDFLRKGSVAPSEQVLQRATEIKMLIDNLVVIDRDLQQFNAEILTFNQKLTLLKKNKYKVVEQQQVKQIKWQQLSHEKVLKEQEYQLNLKQKKILAQQLIDIETKRCVQQSNYAKSLEIKLQLIEKNDNYKHDKQVLLERDQVQQQLHNDQRQLQSLHKQHHHLGIKVEQVNYNKNQLDVLILKNIEVANTLTAQKKEVQQAFEQNKVSLEANQQTLKVWLADMSHVDNKLLAINKAQSGVATSVNQLEENKRENLIQIDQINAQINKQNLEGQDYKLRAELALEQLAEQQKNVVDVEAMMLEEVKEGVWQAHIIRLAKDINRLGPINLAAINEYESQIVRKNYLDQQNDDLTQAISTLESAIEKIDKESRQKFQVTFDMINKDLNTLFPKVFGGGSAYLELTGDDLLDTGVSIMARPPGKKNSTIHLLSGGEKALTALSLVFAIFRLNPAPFCMLDEVDAPLDDANVERFCNLVKEMSQTVQFIYISHNKIAMEMASHLIGVTMFEPGVSRMVAVDIDEAIAMAGNT